MSLKTDMKKAIRAALDAGWFLDDTPDKRHVMLHHSSGATVVASVTPSDHRAIKNFQSDIKRATRREGVTI